MTSSMLRRQLKNLVQNYSEAEVKVREATSNDPWGPSSTQMADISDLTYNVVACNEIMTMLWKRLKDDKNWRHIHKSLTLLEYLLKTGDDRVLLKMKDNIYIVKALTEFRFVEKDGKDQGVNVREKAKVVLVLMEDDEKLKEEREFAVKTREKTSKSAAASSKDELKDPNYKPCYVPGATGLPSLDNIPSVADLTASFAARKEERLRQEAEKREAERRSKMTEDELKWEDAGKAQKGKPTAPAEEEKTDPWDAAKEAKEETDPWGAPTKPDPWAASAPEPPADEDPFAAPKEEEDPFAAPKNGEDPFVATKNGEDPFTASKNEEDPFTAPKDKPDPFSAPKNGNDPFVAKNDSDPFNTPKNDPFSTPENSSDPFDAPKDKEDPFGAPKDKPDPFSSAKDDPFNAPKDDPFNAPKDDPFNTPKDDPFNAPKDDPFNAPKDDPFNAPKDDPFNAPKDDPFNAPKEDPFNTPKDDPFSAPKEDPFNAPADDPFNAPKDDPFGTPKDDPFSTPKDDPFTAPQGNADPFAAQPTTPPKEDPFGAPTTPPKEDPFGAPTTPPKEDPFAAPTTPPKEDPFGAPTTPPKEDPFAAPTTPPKDDPFAAPTSPPKDSSPDPFDAPLASPQKDDAWGAPASSPPSTGADPWGAPSAPQTEAKGGDPWGDDPTATSPVASADPFGDAQTANDPWDTPAAAAGGADDAWGSPLQPSDSTTSDDPFGDAGSKGASNDPWGAPSNAPSDGTDKPTAQGEESSRKAASFLGLAGASLVDLDSLLSSHPKPKHPPFNTLTLQPHPAGALKGTAVAGGPAGKTISNAGVSLSATPPTLSSLFASNPAPTYSVYHPNSGAPSSRRETSPYQPSYSFGMPQRDPAMPHFGSGECASYLGAGMLQPTAMGGISPIGRNVNPTCIGAGMVHPSPMGVTMARQDAPPCFGGVMVQPNLFGGKSEAEVVRMGSHTPCVGQGLSLQSQWLPGLGSRESNPDNNNNPFLS